MHAIYVKNKNVAKKPFYKYYVPGVICKMIGGIGLCLVYSFYYTYGGDVTNYFLAANTYVSVLYDFNFDLFFELVNFFNYNVHLSGYWEQGYGEINFNNTDYYALLTVLLTVPSCILGCKSFIATTLVLSYISFVGLWKLYQVFVDQFPMLQRQFAIAIFFVPSVFFWGSGLLKDTYTLSALGFVTYSVYKYLIKKERKLRYLLLLIASSMILIFIKPYIFFAILPGSLIWTFFYRITRIRNPFFKTMALPILLVGLTALVVFALEFLGQYLGEYNLDNVLDKAVKTQQDLIRGEQYGGNNFDIGKFDPTIAGISSKIPVAINMALFRPYLWDAKNPVMLLSGIENLFLLGFSIYILINVKFSVLFRSLFSHPLLIFAFLFALFFAFSVGLTTANYGALVRLRIPCIPFYLTSLFILFYLNKESFKGKAIRI